MPEEGPLQSLAALELVFEAEGVVLVGELEEVCQARLDYFMLESLCRHCFTYKAVQPKSRGL